FDLMARSGAWGQETVDFQSTWTVYYWAWWISWSPFVGIFIARISRGRTIRQFILGVILIPSSLLFVAYGVMGASSIWMYREGKPGFTDDMAAPQVLFTLVDNLDRKSTRLNSSHVSSSYAVFCLKKKTSRVNKL